MRMLSLPLAFGVFILAQGLQASTTIPKALKLRLNEQAFEMISQQASERFLTPIRNKPLPNLDTKVDHGIRITSSGMNLSADFSDFQIETRQDRLFASVKLNNVQLIIPRIRAQKKIIFNISTTCRNTTINIGHHEPVTVQGFLSPDVTNNKLSAKFDNVEVHIPQNSYSVKGPTRCSGKLGIGKLIRSIARKALKKSRGKIEKGLVSAIHSVEPKLSSMIDRMAHHQLPLNSISLPGIPSINQSLSVIPESAIITDSEFEITLATHIKESSKIAKQRSHSLLNATTIGQFGIQTFAISQLIEIIFKEMEIDMTPFLEDQMSLKEELGEFWPDLKQQDIQNEDLRIFLRLNEFPKLQIMDDELHINHLGPKLTLQLRHGTSFLDYYHLFLGLDFSLRLRIEQGQLTIQTGENFFVNVDGEWAEIEPFDPHVSLDEIQDLAQGGLNELFAGMDVFSMATPSFELQGTKLGVNKVSLKDAHIFLDLVSESM